MALRELIDNTWEGISRQPDAKSVLPKRPARPAKTSNMLVTEDSAAAEFAELYGGRLRFCHDSGAWFEWDGISWRQNRTGVAFNWARLLARKLVENEPDRVRYTTSKTSFATGVEKFARADPTFAVTIDTWDNRPFLLGTPAGTVDLEAGELRKSDSADGITKLAGCAPAQSAFCPRWLQFLDEATGKDEGAIRFLQQWCGYSLTGDTREHALIFVYGPGGNGKSVFLNVLTGIMGDYAATAAMDTFTASHNDKHPTDLAMLRGARLVTASETEEGRAWAEARIKQMTGGDVITARFMRQDFFSFRPAFKLTIVGNHKPALRNVDDAAKRRFNIVPFTRKPTKPDPELEAKLREEWPQILRWMIDGCLDWQKNGLVRPASVTEATQTYFADQDLLGQWLEECCDVDADSAHLWDMSSDLFASWSEFARKAGENPGSAKTFADGMRRKGFQQHRMKTARGFRGIRLKQGHSYASDDG